MFFLGIGNVITIKLDSIECSCKYSRNLKYRFVLSWTEINSLSVILPVEEFHRNKNRNVKSTFHLINSPDPSSSSGLSLLNSLMRSSKYLFVSSLGFFVISGNNFSAE